jgi:hypothetical protein
MWLLMAVATLGVAGLVWAQGRDGGQPQGPPPNVSNDPLLRGFEFRSISPATMMGRVDDIAGAEKDPMIIHVGFATGGLWKSTDGGNHWHSEFDNLFGPNPDRGLYKSTDGGKTWKKSKYIDENTTGSTGSRLRFPPRKQWPGAADAASRACPSSLRRGAALAVAAVAEAVGFGGFAPLGNLVEPGAYMVRLTVGGQTQTSSVDVLEDTWMRPQ